MRMRAVQPMKGRLRCLTRHGRVGGKQTNAKMGKTAVCTVLVLVTLRVTWVQGSVFVLESVYGCGAAECAAFRTVGFTSSVVSWSVAGRLAGPQAGDEVHWSVCDVRAVVPSQPVLSGGHNYCVPRSARTCASGFVRSDVMLDSSWNASVLQDSGAWRADHVTDDVMLPLCCMADETPQTSNLTINLNMPLLLIKRDEGTPCPRAPHFSVSEETVTVVTEKIALCYYQPETGLGRSCPLGWQVHAGYCYYFSAEAKSWFAAREACADFNATLVSVTNPDEEAWLAGQMFARRAVSLEFYLGLSDLQQEDVWLWQDGLPLQQDFINWNPNEPNDALFDEDCVFYKVDTGDWNDITCSHPVNFICKRVAVSEPRPLSYTHRVTSSSRTSRSRPSHAVDQSPVTCLRARRAHAQWVQVDMGRDVEVLAVVFVTASQPLIHAAIHVGFTPHDFHHQGAHACALNVTTQYMTSLILCVQPVRGRYLTILQPNVTEGLYGIEACDIRIHAIELACGLPVGVSTGEVLALQLSASSYTAAHPAHLARLGANSAWCPDPSDPQPYIQVELSRAHALQALHVQIEATDRDHVTYSVLTGGAHGPLQPVLRTPRHVQVFGAGVQRLPANISAQRVRIQLEEFVGAGPVCLRFELYGCPHPRHSNLMEDVSRCPTEVGFPAVPLPRRGSSYMYAVFSVPCSGHVTAVHYHATDTSPFTLFVWRPVAQSSLVLLHREVLIPLSTGGQHVNIDPGLGVESRDWVAVHPGTSLSYGYAHDRGVTSVDVSRAFTFDLDEAGGYNITSLDWTLATETRITFPIYISMNSSENISDAACGSILTSPGHVTSPGFPRYYGQGRSCVWTIEVPSGKFASINFEEFNLGDEDAYGCSDELLLTAERDSRMTRVYTGQAGRFPLIMLPDRRLQLHLVSCVRHKPQLSTGFSAHLQFVDCAGCGVGSASTDHVCTHACGWLATPGYPYPYPPNSRQTWHIRVPEWNYIRLELGSLWVESVRPQCDQDFLYVFDADFQGNQKVLGRYCNAHPPAHVLFSSWHQMALQFASDVAFSGQGFLAHYTSAQFSIPPALQERIQLHNTSCPAGWVRVGPSCYRAETLAQGTSWVEAEAGCARIHAHAHLVSILSAEEMLVVHYLLTAVWRARQTTTYIGLTDAGVEGQFRWSDRRPMIYTAWANTSTSQTAQPDGGELEDCTVLRLANLYATNQWHDVPCALNDVQQYVCKMDAHQGMVAPVEIPEPTLNMSASQIGLFLCGSGDYTREFHVCDGISHCQDGTDEFNCTVCGQDQLHCGEGQCVHVSKFCDLKPDCINGADEQTCELPACRAGEFQCESGQCVDGRQRCDILPDCVDGSDEMDCASCQRPDTFQCYDGRCIPWHARCDSVKDCSGCTSEDEQACVNSLFALCDETIVCDWRPLEGYGTLSLTPVTTNEKTDSMMTSRVTVSYLGVSTDDELMAIVDKSYRCEQRVWFACPGVINTTVWQSLTRDLTRPLVEEDCWTNEAGCGVVVREWSALPVKVVFVDGGACPGVDLAVTVDTLVCFTEVGAREVGSVMRCDSGQRTQSRYACVFEFDPYGVQRGCRDMSHVQGCSELATVYTECKKSADATDYKGTISVTRSGRICQRWDMQTPHKHPFTDPVHYGEDSVSDAHNFCRNADKGLPTYCFTMDPERRYEPCDIPICANDTGETWTFQCPADYVKCPGDYCIPVHYVCNTRWDCPNGEDEAACESHSCAGRYTCAGSDNCLPLTRMCDGVRDCTQGDDEALCDVTCPALCACSGLAAHCKNAQFTSFPPDLDIKIRTLDLSQNKIEELPHTPYNFPFLMILNLSHNALDHLRPYQFDLMRNLMTLDLSHNAITYLSKQVFYNLTNVRTLVLAGNPRLRTVDAGAFLGLTSLAMLSLSKMSINHIINYNFEGLDSLTELDLSSNNIQAIEDAGFVGLGRLQVLSLVDNPLRTAFRQTFQVLGELGWLTTDSFKWCCLAEQVPRDQCLPPQDPISTCEDLMSTGLLRAFLWLLGILALLGNVFVITWRLRFPTSNVPEIIINNLALSDLLMGLYMLTIAGVDLFYQGVFIEYAQAWRESWLCKAAGFLGTLSSEGSVLFLCLLTLDRFVNILFPFSDLKLSKKGARVCAVGVWLVALVASGIPLLPLEYFGDSFYGRSGVCLALPITNERPPGWQYSTAVFIGFNLAGFLVIALGYSVMYVAISRSSQRAAGGMQRRQQVALAKNMMLIIVTDFVCWLPIIAMGFAALNGAAISGQVYAWVIVFLLPVNSAINPILYTGASLDVRQKLVKKIWGRFRQDTESSSVSRVASAGCDSLAVSLHDNLGAEALRGTVTRAPRPLHVTLHVTHQLAHLLDTLHGAGTAHGHLAAKHVQVTWAKQGGVRVWLRGADLGSAADSGLDCAEDIHGLGSIVKELLQGLNPRLTKTSQSTA